MPKAKVKSRIRRRWLSRLEVNMQRMTLGRLIGWTSALIVGLGVIMNASGYVIAVVIGWWTSGPLPYAGRIEVEGLSKSTAMKDQEIIHQLDELSTRQQQSIERGAVVAENLQELTISILKTKLSDAEADLARNPTSDAARKLVNDYRIQLDGLEAMSMRLK